MNMNVSLHSKGRIIFKDVPQLLTNPCYSSIFPFNK